MTRNLTRNLLNIAFGIALCVLLQPLLAYLIQPCWPCDAAAGLLALGITLYYWHD